MARNEDQDAQFDALVEDYLGQRIDRRELLRRATAAGLTVSAASGLAAYLEDEAQAAKKQRKKILRIGPTSDLTSYTFDPANNSCDCRAAWMEGPLEGLVHYEVKPWGQTPKRKLVKVLAEKYEVSSDGKRVAFALKKGVPFHKGFGEVTAEDVKYSIERVAGLQKLYPDGTKKDVAAYKSEWEQLERVRVTGRYSGVIIFKEPSPFTLDIVLPISSSSLVISRKAAQKLGKNGIATTPIGTGPYELALRDPPRRHVLRRFKGWQKHWDRPTYWDEIHYIWGAAQPGQASTIMLEAGEVDFLPYPTVEDFHRLRSNPKFRAYSPRSVSYSFIGVNPTHRALKDIRVRRAVRLAIDVPALMRIAREPLKNRAWAIQGPNFGIGYWKDAPRWQRDPAEARRLLQQAGVTTPVELDLINYFDVQGQAELLQAQLAEVGINVNIISTPPDDWYTKPEAERPALVAITYGGRPDPQYQFSWFTCDQVGIWNWAFWCNQRYSRKFEELGRTVNPRRREQLAIEMQKLMYRSEAIVWLYYLSLRQLSLPTVRPAYDSEGTFHPTSFRPA